MELQKRIQKELLMQAEKKMLMPKITLNPKLKQHQQSLNKILINLQDSNLPHKKLNNRSTLQKKRPSHKLQWKMDKMNQRHLLSTDRFMIFF